MSAHSKRKSPTVAALLNFFLAGMGYIYCERYLLGFFAFFFFCGFAVISFGLLALPLLFIYFVDGLLSARNYNKEQEKAYITSTKKCPKCAERVSAEASLCRFCQHSFTEQLAQNELPPPTYNQSPGTSLGLFFVWMRCWIGCRPASLKILAGIIAGLFFYLLIFFTH